MPDPMADRLIAHQAEKRTADLARDARRLANAATQFANSITQGGSYSGDARRLAADAAQLSEAAARLDGMREVAEVYAAPEVAR